MALRIVPAVTGGALAYGHVEELGSAVLVFAALLLGTYLTSRLRYPLHLMPAGRIAVGLAGPLLGALIALGVGALEESHLTAGDLVVPVIGAWLIMAIGAGASQRLKTDRPVRIGVVGTAEVARSLAAELAIARVRGFQTLGWIGPPAADSALVGGLEWLGPVGDLRAAVLRHHIDLLVYSPTSLEREGGKELTGGELLEHVAHACLDLPVRMLDANQLYEELLGHVPIGTIDAAWFRYIMHPRYRPGSPISRRVVDLVLGMAAALIALPVVAIAAAAIKLDDRGPVFFRQRRVGEHGREFEILKLRTMRLDSEQEGSRWTSVGDERLTRVGRMLRRTHVDELPQLWNVLRGDMSLVGPRPERPDLVSQLERQISNYERRHLVKPGITGWAQIRCGYAGSEMGTAWKLCHDLYYLKHRSFLTDLLLLVETAAILPLDPDRNLRTPSHRFLAREGSRV